MPKNFLQDLKVSRHKPDRALDSIRIESKALSEMRRREAPAPAEWEREEPRVSRRPRYTLWLVAAVSVLFCLFAVSYLFAQVTVVVNPKMSDISLNENLSAVSGAADALSFDLIIISGEKKGQIETAEEKEVSEKAEGSVVIYNTFSSATQLLSIDTRLEGSNGKIYKTKKQIIVPGMKGSTPGSVEVGIYAAEAGAEYNSGPLDFTIFGFRGTPKYSKFYARSAGPIEGGFKGKTPFVSDEKKQSATNGIRKSLETELSKKATEQIPSGFVLFKDAIFLDIDDSGSLVYSEDKTASLSLKGTLYGLIFDENKLAKKIAENKIKEYNGAPVSISNIRDLTFSLINKNSVSFADAKKIDFNLKGAAKIIWKLDEPKFIADLLGKPKKDFDRILSQYPNVDSADLTISPFWKMTLPDKSKDIKVIVNEPK